MNIENFKSMRTPSGIYISDGTDDYEVDDKYRLYTLTLHGKYLGFVYWSEANKQYGFFPDKDLVFTGGLLKDIYEFIDILMADRVLS